VNFNTNSRILKANSSWSPTWVKFCQLIASLPVVLPQLNVTTNTDKNIFATLEFDFFRVQLKFAFRIRP